jgi:4-hydroxy-tetrahydrodipicolinate reductase
MKFYLIGSSGKMGKEILTSAENAKDICVRGFGSKDKLSFEQKVDVVIDFSSAKLFSKVVDACVKNKLPLISGTTGLSSEDFKKLKDASKTIPVLWAANTSLGIQVVRNLLSLLSPVAGWDFHIIESHHIHKKDAPSGTALVLKKDLETAIGKKVPDCSAIRGGGIFGEHTIQIMGPSETISIQHTALSRKVFADGALQAARFLAKKPKGLYTMEDVLKGK